MLTRPLRFIFWIAAFYGIAHIPIAEKPVWRHIQISALHVWQKTLSFVGERREKAIKMKEKWLKRPKKSRVSRQRQNRKAIPQEEITSVEEKRLESFLDP